MKKYWTEVHDTWRASPMAFWVHVETDDRPWYQAEHFDPPAPKPVAGGYTIYFVEVDGFVFEFSSLAQMRCLIETLSQKVLPTTIRLSRERGGVGGKGPGGHWLSKLPGTVKPWRYRRKAVPYLEQALKVFERTHGP